MNSEIQTIKIEDDKELQEWFDRVPRHLKTQYPPTNFTHEQNLGRERFNPLQVESFQRHNQFQQLFTNQIYEDKIRKEREALLAEKAKLTKLRENILRQQE